MARSPRAAMGAGRTGRTLKRRMAFTRGHHRARVNAYITTFQQVVRILHGERGRSSDVSRGSCPVGSMTAALRPAPPSIRSAASPSSTSGRPSTAAPARQGGRRRGVRRHGDRLPRGPRRRQRLGRAHRPHGTEHVVPMTCTNPGLNAWEARSAPTAPAGGPTASRDGPTPTAPGSTTPRSRCRPTSTPS